MSNFTFAESFCEQNQIAPEQFARAVFNRVIYRRTRVVAWLLPRLWRGYFAADFDLIYSVEGLKRMRDFAPEVTRFSEHPANRGWLRRTLCLRVSTNRLRALIRETLPRSVEGDTAEPPVRGRTIVPFDFTATTGCPGGLSDRGRAAPRGRPSSAPSRPQQRRVVDVSEVPMDRSRAYQGSS
jgi:hypothetical protein